MRTVVAGGETAGNVISWWEGSERRLGYWLGRAHWGRGVGTRAVSLFLEEEKTRPLYADPVAGNTASIRLLERLGFRRSGTVTHGEDEHIMLILNDPAGGGG
ncbi:GNAT family protein [Spongiactinospora sp. TRM90649]|uniref:GNAT family N-acetyltransferase n=1 Tax=Spongiactinospora sp. TRM90649 TaxID=3031114 RepID=UPI0023F9131E|nr:GNAT family protein [Spongiactinospora sp. TRM90649]MDF5759215.1 GNAT family protein [Spongiactinospora sp. TRM90649]